MGARHRRSSRRRSIAWIVCVLCAAGCGASTPGGSDTHATPGSPSGSASDAGAVLLDAAGAPATDAGGSGPHAAPDAAPPTIAATFRTLDTSQYLSAVGGGGSTLSAASATAGAAETFALTDRNGGALVDGDEVTLAASTGAYVIAIGGGGADLRADALAPSDDATFVVTRIDGPGTVASGDHVALKTKQKVNYVSAINGGGGDVRADAPWARAWETFTLTLGSAPVTPPATSARQKVLDYLNGLSGKKTIAGQHNKFNSGPADSTNWIKTNTGKQPGFWSADFGFGQDAISNRAKMITEAKKQWSEGAVVQIMYHNCIPTRDELCGWDDIGGANPQHLSDTEWSDLVTDGTTLNNAWKARLDTLSVFFADLKAAGVAPLFRPLHEMNQGVFWWGGRGGATGTRRLFQITHDYLVNTKGFDNIIWVWDIQDFGTLASDVTSYDPGAAYYDIAALDVYDGPYDQSKYDAMKGVAGGKPIAIGECEHPPTSQVLAQQPGWVFFMLWPDFLDENAAVLPPLYNASNVVTEDQMPGWH